MLVLIGVVAFRFDQAQLIGNIVILLLNQLCIDVVLCDTKHLFTHFLPSLSLIESLRPNHQVLMVRQERLWNDSTLISDQIQV